MSSSSKLATTHTSKVTVDSMAGLLSSVVDPSGNSVEAYISTFLIDPSSNNYNAMKPMIEEFLAPAKKINNTARMLIAQSDGTVVYDSKSGINNLYENISLYKTTSTTIGNTTYYKNTFLINENHGNRTSYLAAMLSSSGKAYTIKPSNSTSTNQFYVALRLGPSTFDPYGIVIISCDV